MTLTELINNVYTITNRPDRVDETLQAVLSATLKAHQSDYYYKDIFETGVDCENVAYIHDIDYRQLIPTWRAIKYLRKWVSPGAPPNVTNAFQVGTLLKLVEPMNVLDDYSLTKQDIYYIAGSTIHINSSTQDQYYLLGCYLNPNVTQANYSSWIALDHPWAIIYGAAATVFKAIGKDEENVTYRQLVADEIALLKSSNIVANGF